MTTAFRVLRDDINPLFYRVLVAALLLLIGSTVLLRFAYHDPERPMNWVDALYFTASTVATVGYGDFSFIDQHTWLRLWGIGLIFVGLLTTAILVAFIADLLLSRRFVQSAGRRQVRHLRDHIVVVGLGSFGIRVVSDLKAAGHDVAVIERNEDNRYLSLAAELDVPVIFGDAKLRQTLEAARLDEARAVALLTQDDMVNIETGIVLREMLGPRVLPELNRPDVPIVLRVYDRALGAAVAQRFGFDYVRSSRIGRPVVHRGGNGTAGLRHVFGGPTLVHGRRRPRRARQCTRRVADGGPVHPEGGRGGDPGHGRGHRLPRRAVPGTGGHAAQGTAHPPAVRRQSLSDDRLNPAPVGSATAASRP